MLAYLQLICVWLVILGSCFGSNTEKVIEELRQELKETKEGLTQVIDSLKKEIDGMKNDREISKPTCKFALLHSPKVAHETSLFWIWMHI